MKTKAPGAAQDRDAALKVWDRHRNRGVDSRGERLISRSLRASSRASACRAARHLAPEPAGREGKGPSQESCSSSGTGAKANKWQVASTAERLGRPPVHDEGLDHGLEPDCRNGSSVSSAGRHEERGERLVTASPHPQSRGAAKTKEGRRTPSWRCGVPLPAEKMRWGDQGDQGGKRARGEREDWKIKKVRKGREGKNEMGGEERAVSSNEILFFSFLHSFLIFCSLFFSPPLPLPDLSDLLHSSLLSGMPELA